MLVWAFARLAAAAPAEQSSREAASKPGPHSVEANKYDWRDASRDRDVPVKCYYPQSGSGPLPVIIFSHGVGGSREGYEYLGHYWASHGYVSVHLQHKGSDVAVRKGQVRKVEALRQSVLDLRNSINRALDVRFAIDQLEKMNRDETPLRGRLDLTRVGMAGHSYGAWTTLTVIGEVLVGPDGPEKGLTDPRIKAAIAMSPPVFGDKQNLAQEYGQIEIPCLHMTGTQDNSPIGETKAKDRRVPFDHISAADQYLIIFSGADHMTFSNRERFPKRGKEVMFHELIQVVTTAFWDAYLKDARPAKVFLTAGGLPKLLGKEGALEKKLKAP